MNPKKLSKRKGQMRIKSKALKQIFVNHFMKTFKIKSKKQSARLETIEPHDNQRSLFHMGQNSKQINITKYVSKFLMYGTKMLDKFVESKRKFLHIVLFLQSQAKSNSVH